MIFISKELVSKLRNGVRIMSIEARYLYSVNKKVNKEGIVEPITDGVGYDTVRYWDSESKKRRLPDKLYSVKIPYSLCLEKMYNVNSDEFLADDYDITYSDMVINVSFKGAAKKEKELKPRKDGTVRVPKPKYIIKKRGTGKNEFNTIKKVNRLQTELKTGDLRTYMYENGFILNGDKYVFFMRSTSKSRGGNMLFIKQEYFYGLLMEWARLGIVFPKEEAIDIAGIKSYESLVLSGICGELEIKPEEILLINDYESVFEKRASVTKSSENNRLMVNDEAVTYRNAIWDGQSLMDSSKYSEFIEFDDVSKSKSLCGKSFVLLRNLWFKSAAFNFDIQRYFADNNVTLEDVKKHGWTIAQDIKQIKLITTPNSLKILKIKKFIENKYIDDKDGQLRTMFEHWLRFIEDNSYFGVVKSEHGIFDRARRCNAQVLMALPLSRDDIRTLLKEDEFSYMRELRNDDDMFLMHIGNGDNSNNRIIYELAAYVPKFVRTDMFTSFKNNTLNDYKENWKKEGIKISNSDFCVCVSNPIEMIQYACGVEPENWVRVHKGREAYCEFYNKGQELIAARNPCVCSGNILCLTNKYDKMLDYLNLSDNIVVVNSIESDIMERASSMDFDSDQLWLSSNKLLVEKAKYCEEHFLTPVNQISKEEVCKHNIIEDLASTDNQISKGKVGDVVNVGQILQSYYWHIYFTLQPESEEEIRKKEQALKKIYDKISMLSSASCAEIDSAKRKYNIDTDIELSDLRNIGLSNNEDLYDYMDYGKLIGTRKRTITEKEINANPDILEAFNKIEEYKVLKELRELSEEEQKDSNEKYDLINEFLRDKHKKGDSKEKLRKPLYFKFAFPNSVENSIYFEEGMNCPMDNLCTIVDEETPTKKTHEDKINIMDLMNRYELRPNDKHIVQVKEIAEKYTKACNAKKFNASSNNDDVKIEGLTKKEYFAQYVKDMQAINLTTATIVSIFNACYGSKQAKAHNKDMSKMKKNMLDLIYAAHRDTVLECFKGTVVFGRKYFRKQFLQDVGEAKSA